MIDYDLTKIRAIAFDIDGVLSDPRVLLINGELIRTANTKDGYAMQLAVKQGLHLSIITGGRSDSIKVRYEGLGMKDIFMGCSYKTEKLQEWMKKYNLKPEEVMYMGDDIPDYQVMQRVGCSCCPADAAPEIKEIATYVSNFPGGHGCARDVLEQVLKAQGLWMSDVKAFGW